MINIILILEMNQDSELPRVIIARRAQSKINLQGVLQTQAKWRLEAKTGCLWRWWETKENALMTALGQPTQVILSKPWLSSSACRPNSGSPRESLLWACALSPSPSLLPLLSLLLPPPLSGTLLLSLSFSFFLSISHPFLSLSFCVSSFRQAALRGKLVSFSWLTG